VGQSPGEGDSWDEAGGVSDQLLVELLLNKGTTLASNQQVSLGTPFRTSVFGPGNDGDLVFQYAITGQTTMTAGIVQYVTTGPATAVPEPGALGVTMAGCLAAAAATRRRRA
jgi:hypothetical protein